MFLLVVILLIAGFLIYRHYTWKALPWPAQALIPPDFQGHRGYWKEGAQENTMASFKAAAARGLQMIEMDVRLSRDGIPVIFHDVDLKRLAHRSRRVEECTAQELQSWAQAPSLEEVLSSREIPQNLNIELKTSAAFDGRLEKAVAALILKYKAERRIVFSSFNPMSLYRLSRLLPDVPRALLVTWDDDPENKFYLRKMWFAPYMRLHALHLDHHYVTPQDVQKWKRRKVPVALWTVNEREKAEAYLQAGALSIITDELGKTPELKS